MQTLVRGVVDRAIREERGEDAVDGSPVEAPVSKDRKLEPIHAGDLCDLLELADERLPWPEDEVRRRLGRRTLENLAREHPSFFVDAADTEGFLTSLEEEIYPHLSRLFPEMAFPEIAVQDPTKGEIEIVYRSEIGACRFVEGMIEGLAERYGETVAIRRSECVHEGDPRCTFHVTVEG